MSTGSVKKRGYWERVRRAKGHPKLHLLFAVLGFTVKTFYGTKGDRYFTRVQLQSRDNPQQLCLHIFYRPDRDRYRHTHRWWFDTFPLFWGYTESVIENDRYVERVVRPWRWNRRKADFVHRIERFHGPVGLSLIRRGEDSGNWGFMVPEPDWHLFDLGSPGITRKIDGLRHAFVHWVKYYDALGASSSDAPVTQAAA